MHGVPKVGVPMSPAEAKAFVDELNRKVLLGRLHSRDQYAAKDRNPQAKDFIDTSLLEEIKKSGYVDRRRQSWSG